MLKKYAIILGTISILLYLLFSRGLWLADQERQVDIGKNRFTKKIDISKSKTVFWKINEEDWDYTGKARIALIVDRLPEISEESYDKTSIPLMVQVDAYAVVSNSESEGNSLRIKRNRLIKNWFYTTNKPLEAKAQLSMSKNYGPLQYGLGAIERYPNEHTYISINILKEDPILAKANPRLEIVGEHDPEIQNRIIRLRITRDLCLALVALFSILIARQAIKTIPKE